MTDYETLRLTMTKDEIVKAVAHELWKMAISGDVRAQLLWLYPRVAANTPEQTKEVEKE